MVTLYVGGKAVSWADGEKLFAEAASTQAIEFRDAAGRVIATSVPGAEPVPAWEEVVSTGVSDKPVAEPGYTLEQWRKRLGWE